MRASGAPFLPLKIGAAIPVSPEASDTLQCVESETDQYTVRNWWEAFQRVLCYNPPQSSDYEEYESIRKQRLRDSLLGPNGHVERMNAWTHILGVLIFAIFSFVRPATVLDSTSSAGRLSAASSAVVVVTFGVSVMYHTLGTVRHLAPVMRMLDHSSIYVSLAVTTTCDLAVVTLDFLDVPWQCSWDSVFVAAILLAFFSYRRLVLDPSYTEVGWGDCRMGLFRFQHSDYSHSSFRSAGYLVLTLGFLQLLPVAFRNLDPVAALSIVVCNTIGLVLLIAGLLLDNVLIWPDVLFKPFSLTAKVARTLVKGDSEWMQKGRRKQPLDFCYNPACGCVFTSHAIWHVCTLLSVLTLTVGREVAIARTPELRE
tara:strand:- start:244 stop:1350 length:1107 start_codon:yes stop_codon:yes gene_type:complete